MIGVEKEVLDFLDDLVGLEHDILPEWYSGNGRRRGLLVIEAAMLRRLT